jgi:hypothetical protein
MANEQLTSLANYSRQELEVGRPPRFVFDKEGKVQDRELLALSVQLRLAEALEAQNERLAQEAGRSSWVYPYQQLPPINTWVLITTNPRFEPVPIMTAGLTPDGTWVDYDGNAIQLPLAWQYLPASAPRPDMQKGEQANG